MHLSKTEASLLNALRHGVYSIDREGCCTFINDAGLALLGYQGTGLGLAQIYGFARQSGGTATIDSAVGTGTTVALYFPRADTEGIEATSCAAASATMRGQGKTVLLVEDQSEVREVVEMSLDSLGFRVVTGRGRHCRAQGAGKR